MKLFFAIIAVALASVAPAFGQNAEDADAAPDGPVLSVTFEETEAAPGQPLTLRLTVLVPTFMPSPPVWPSLETPNVLVRLPERSTGPTSDRVGGQTWSGVTRRYRISPMVPGEFAVPPQAVTVTYADPETNEPVEATLQTEPIRFTGVVPEGAEGLDPFLAAADLSLEQTIDGEPGAMTPGESFTRTVTAVAEGTPAMFIPDLIPASAVPGVAAYPDEPVTSDSENRGTVTGTRTERVTYVAEGGGRGEVAPVRLDWFDLGSGSLATALVDGVAVVVDGPPARSAEPRDWRLLVGLAVAAAAILALFAFLGRRAAPAVRRRLAARRAAHLSSERYAWRRLKATIGRRDVAALYNALDRWAERVKGTDPRLRDDVEAALVAIGAARYGHRAGGTGQGWPAFAAAVTAARRDAVRRPSRGALPPLNPTTASP